VADELVKVELGPIFYNFESRILSLRDRVTTEGAKILRQEEEASIRLRWYDSGKTLRSLQEEFATEGRSEELV